MPKIFHRNKLKPLILANPGSSLKQIKELLFQKTKQKADIATVYRAKKELIKSGKLVIGKHTVLNSTEARILKAIYYNPKMPNSKKYNSRIAIIADAGERTVRQIRKRLAEGFYGKQEFFISPRQELLEAVEKENKSKKYYSKRKTAQTSNKTPRQELTETIKKQNEQLKKQKQKKLAAETRSTKVKMTTKSKQYQKRIAATIMVIENPKLNSLQISRLFTGKKFGKISANKIEQIKNRLNKRNKTKLLKRMIIDSTILDKPNIKPSTAIKFLEKQGFPKIPEKTIRSRKVILMKMNLIPKETKYTF